MSRPRLKKHLGQHHLRRGDLCRPLLDFLRPAGERVLEVGPGGGILTRELVARGARVLAVELDLDWLPGLARSTDRRSVSLVAADALELDWSRVHRGTLIGGNLPYNVATPIIERVLSQGMRFPRSAFLVQREVAERLTAGPGETGYGATSVLTAARAEARRLGSVPRSEFRPPPRVDGAFVGFTPRGTPFPEAEMEGFVATVRLAFSRRRKTLRNCLSSGWGRQGADAVLESLGIGPHGRAEELSLEGFTALHRMGREQGSC